jgi:multidrug efflux pump subunit AcrA (membrane-fusion protein)
VTTTSAQTATLPVRLSANGNIAAWQEASVGTEANGLRLAEVRVNVGDVVKRGQVLAAFAPDTVQADLSQCAPRRRGRGDARRRGRQRAARPRAAATGALSAQQINQYLTAERTAKAARRLRARRQVQQLRLQQTQVLAPDNGIISARNATVGAVLPAGQELFRLIRQGRLEWRAEVPRTTGEVKPACRVAVHTAAGARSRQGAHGRADRRRQDPQRHRLRRPAGGRRRAAPACSRAAISTSAPARR